jgi:hypothetical protein
MNLDETNWPEALLQLSEQLEDTLCKLGFPSTAHVVEVQRAILRGTLEVELEGKAEDPLVTLCAQLKHAGDTYHGDKADIRVLPQIYPIRDNDKLWKSGWRVHGGLLDAQRNGWCFYEGLGLLLSQPACFSAYELGCMIDMALEYLDKANQRKEEANAQT